MLRRATMVLLALFSLFLTPVFSVEAQVRTALEVRGGVNLPLGDFSDTPGLEAEGRWGFGAQVLLPVHRLVGVYVGGEGEIFDCARCSEGEDILVSGVTAGVKILVPMGPVAWTPWVKLGATLHALDFEAEGVEGESGWGRGFEAAAGLDIPLGRAMSLSPGIRYHSHTAELETTDPDFLAMEEEVRYFSVSLGLSIHLGSN